MALGLIKISLLYKRLVSFVLDFISWSLVNASYFSDDKSSKKEMKSCIQARTTHVVNSHISSQNLRLWAWVL
jgi:hypothetical protein